MPTKQDIPTGAWNLLTGPWALNADYAAQQIGVINAMDWNAHMAAAPWETEDRPETPYSVEDGIATIDLNGPMTRGLTSMSAMFGGCSTIALRRALKQAASDPNVSGILLRVDSPGGEVDGTADLAAAVKAAAAVKPVIAYVDGSADSAAYWTAAQATEIWAGSTSRLGCIGTYTTLTDSSEAARAEGFRVHVVKAGAFKGTGIPGTEVTPAALTRVQETIDGINEEFLAAVGEGRGMDSAAVTAVADGEEFHARRALELGLMDRIGSEEEATAHLRALAANPGGQHMDTVDAFRALLGMGPRGANDADPTATPEPAAPTLAVGTIAENPLLAACKAANITDAAQIGTLIEAAQLGAEYTAAMRTEAKAEYTRAVGADKADAKRIAALESANFTDAKNMRDMYREAADLKFGTGDDTPPTRTSAPEQLANIAIDIDATTEAEMEKRLESLAAMTDIGRMALANGKGK